MSDNCVTCGREFKHRDPKLLPGHHEGNVKVPMCAKCHWAFHNGSQEVRRRMRKIVQKWIANHSILVESKR